MRRSLALGFASFLLASTPLLALSQTAPPRALGAFDIATGGDQVDLKNGGMLRGTIVSLEPGKEVVILVQGTGEQRGIPWGEVAGTRRGSEGPPGPPPLPPPPPGPGLILGSEVTGPSDGAPRVHIQTEWPGLGLHEVVTSIAVVGYGGAAYGQISRPVCMAPCDRVIDGRAGQLFFFAGEGATPSSRFHLAGRGPEVAVEVQPGSLGKRFGGWLMTGFGAAAVVTSVTLFILGSSSTSLEGDTFVSKTNSGMMIGGGVLLGAGAGLLAGGIVLLVQSGTRYHFLQPSGSLVGGLGDLRWMPRAPLSFAF